MATPRDGIGEWHAQHVGGVCAARAAEVAYALKARVRARCACSRLADSLPMASDMTKPFCFLTCSACCNVRACGSLARLARVQRARRACSVRACSCAGRSAASVGVAVARPRHPKAGAHMPGGAHSFARWSGLLHCKSKKNPFTPFTRTKHAARRNKHERATLALLPLGCSGGQCARSGDHRLPSAVRSSS